MRRISIKTAVKKGFKVFKLTIRHQQGRLIAVFQDDQKNLEFYEITDYRNIDPENYFGKAINKKPNKESVLEYCRKVFDGISSVTNVTSYY